MGGGEGKGGGGAYNQSLTFSLPLGNHHPFNQLLAFIIKEEYCDILFGNYLATSNDPVSFSSISNS